MIIGIIPSRYASTRFPGKPLIHIAGKSMIHRVYEQASKCKALDRIVVATDDDRIYREVKLFGGEVVMTSQDHPSGTDRCFDALKQMEEKYDYVINIQGDEPLIDPEQIGALAAVLQDGKTELATLIQPIAKSELIFDINEVKVVVNTAMEALYFSRMAIPYLKDVAQKEWHLRRNYYRHIGLYAYRADVLEKITKLPVSSLEKAESLEQLRWLENGFKIKCGITNIESYGINTPEDLQRVLQMLP